MHLIKSKRVINRKVLIILLATLVWLIADNLLEFVFPTYLDSINKSYMEIGFLLSIASMAGILIDLPMGTLSDHASRRKLMTTGLLVSIIGGILIFSLKGNLMLVFAFMVWGFSYQMWRVPRDAYYASLTKKKHRAESYGFDAEIKYLGQTIGPIIGGFVLLYAGFRGIVGFYSVGLMISIIILFLFIKDTNHSSLGSAMKSVSRLSGFVSEFKEFRSFGMFGVLLLLFSLMLTSWEQILITFQPLFYGPDVLDISPKLGGLLLAFFSLPAIFISYPVGRLADSIGKKTTLLAGLMIMGTSLLIFSQTKNLYAVFGLALLISIGWITSVISVNSLIIDLSYKHKKGEIAGIWNLFMDIGFVVGPLIGGIIAEFTGITNVFFAMGLAFLMSSFAVFFLKDKHRKIG
ncbi:MAG: MFS transporter [Nanoarchaeota archaeon]|nr:MFS transporter [Nanoarchaeota archaeon]